MSERRGGGREEGWPSGRKRTGDRKKEGDREDQGERERDDLSLPSLTQITYHSVTTKQGDTVM